MEVAPSLPAVGARGASGFRSQTAAGQRSKKKASSAGPVGAYVLNEQSGDVRMEELSSVVAANTVPTHQAHPRSAENLLETFQSRPTQGKTIMFKTTPNHSPNQVFVRLGSGGNSVLPRNYMVASSSLCGSSATNIQRPRQKHPSQFVSRRGPLSKTSPYRGVSCYKRTGRWEAHIWHDGRQVHLGTYSTPKEAASIYDIAAIQLRGWGAELNFDISCYKDDPLLKEPICMPGSSLKSADVVKLVQGLKNRRGTCSQSQAHPEQDMMHPQWQVPASRIPGSQDVNLFAHNDSRFTAASTSQTEARSGKYVQQATNSHRILGRNFGYSGRLQEDQHIASDIHGDVVQSRTSKNSSTPNSSNPASTFFRRSGTCFHDNCLTVSTVMPSKVISAGGHINPNFPSIAHLNCSETGFDSQILLTTASPKVSVVAGGLDSSLEVPTKTILEGKPILQGPTAPLIGAQWNSANRVIPSIVRNEGMLHVQYVGGCGREDIERDGELAQNNIVTIPSTGGVPLDSHLQNIRSVLHVTTQHDNVYCEGYTYHRKEAPCDDNLHCSSASRRARPNSLCSRDRFPVFLQLIRDLPATKLVRPVNRSGKKTSEPAQEGEKPFDSDSKLRSGSSHGSAFKTWANNDDARDRSHSDTCRCWKLQGKSGQSTDALSDVNNGGSSIPNDSQSVSEQSGNARKIMHAEAPLPHAECGSDGSVSEAEQGSYDDVMHDDLLAAQELCRLSQMHCQPLLQAGPAQINRKRALDTSEKPCPLTSWKSKKLRTAPARDAHPASTCFETHLWGSKLDCKIGYKQRKVGPCRKRLGENFINSMGDIESRDGPTKGWQNIR